VIQPEPSALLLRAVALYMPILLTVALVVRRRPCRRRMAGVLLATAWNLPALLALNLVAVRAGWWSFDVSAGTVAGVPADLWIGWALLWGAVPVLVTVDRLARAAVALVALDLVLMPLGEPVAVLHRTWLVGEAVAIATCLVPGLLLGRWTARDEHLPWRTGLQVVAFSGLLLFVLPSLVFSVTGEGWAPLLDRPRWHFVLAALVLAPAGGMAIQAVREFVAHGGTPVPLDPPVRLVTSGPYRYVANPMQLGATVIFAGWGVLLASPMVVGGALVAAAFSAGLAAWSEDVELAERFGDDWRAYRGRVRTWWPRWTPAPLGEAAPDPSTRDRGVVYVAAGSCEPCDEVGQFLLRRPSVGLDVEAAEACPDRLTRITYVGDGQRAVGVAAIGRSLEHVNLAWAAASWIARLPVVLPILQLVADAAGGEARPTGPAVQLPSSTGGLASPPPGATEGRHRGGTQSR
jgi:protein-S-isoprenylcysteine O-methyltransferase Ste14